METKKWYCRRPLTQKTALSADNAVLLVSDKNLIGVAHIFEIGNNRFRRRLRFFTDTCTLQGQLLYTGVDNLIGRSADAFGQQSSGLKLGIGLADHTSPHPGFGGSVAVNYGIFG